MTKFEDNISPYLSFVEGAAPSSPAATNFKLYYDSADHLLKWKNSAGAVSTIATGEFASQDNKIATTETTTSATYVDLATPGPSVTLTVGASGKVKLTITATVNNTAATETDIGIIISGANTVAATTYWTVTAAANVNNRVSTTVVLTGLAAGSTTFKMQYARTSGTCSFLNRELLAEPVL